MAITREEVQKLLDAIPDERLAEAAAGLGEFVDPVLLAFQNAPEDDEPTTAEDLKALDEARGDSEQGKTLSLDATMSELPASTRS